MNNPTTKTPTPRTDAATFTGQSEWSEDNAPLLSCVESSLAQQLERELAAARDMVHTWSIRSRVHQQAAEIAEKMHEASANAARENLQLVEKLQQENEVLRRALKESGRTFLSIKKKIVDHPRSYIVWKDGSEVSGVECVDLTLAIINEALANPSGQKK